MLHGAQNCHGHKHWHSSAVMVDVICFLLLADLFAMGMASLNDLNGAMFDKCQHETSALSKRVSANGQE